MKEKQTTTISLTYRKVKVYFVNTMNIESWCTVELNSKQDWTRADRKHDPNGFNSSVFKGASNQHQESSLDFATAEPEFHRERRHFPEKSEY
uniref:Protein SPATA45 homolog n=1 Tax=Nematostella vectensis TaxID=45351 RepID=SPT45_NEMVE|nr:RecName: Full=Protein SPATA45 homolog [Nematostella vectensis]